MFEALDGIMKPWENALKLPAGVTGKQWVPEAIAYALEVPSDLMFDTFGAKLAKGLVGFILSIAPQWVMPMVVPGWSTRDTEDMQGIAKHLLAEGLDPTPDEMVKIANAIAKIRQGISFGSWDSIADAVGMKSIATIQAELNNVGTAVANAVGIQTTYGKGAGKETTPTPTPAAAKITPTVTIESPGFG